MRMRHVDACFLAAECREKLQADGRRRNVGQTARLGHGNAIDRLLDRARPRVGDEHPRIHPQQAQPFRQHPDVVLDAAEDRIIVFVEIEYAHAA